VRFFFTLVKMAGTDKTIVILDCVLGSAVLACDAVRKARAPPFIVHASEKIVEGWRAMRHRGDVCLEEILALEFYHGPITAYIADKARHKLDKRHKILRKCWHAYLGCSDRLRDGIAVLADAYFGAGEPVVAPVEELSESGDGGV
jgi:hypothetical protein